VQVIPNGIDLAEWQAESLTAMGLKGFPILTTVGRVSTRKGQLQVIKMLPELLRHYPDLHYHCIGIATEAGACVAEAKRSGVTAHVTFHGVLDTVDLKRVLLATDIFVMLSQESSTGDVEGFGIAILEANALGVPAIGAMGCGIEDAVDEGTTGFLIDGTDVSVFKNRLDRLLTETDVFKAHAKEWAKRHDWNQLI